MIIDAGMFHMTLGSYDYNLLGNTPYPRMAKVVFVLFQILIPILLLNMLIAMMGNTYGIVIESAEKEFLKAWAKVGKETSERENTKQEKQRYTWKKETHFFLLGKFLI